ncbi:hypothetical protein [Nocardioides sp. HB32]
MSTPEQRRHWYQHAAFLAQLGLDDDPALVDIIEEVANACLALLDEVRRLERDRAEARAWASSEFHRHYDRRWLPTVKAAGLEGGWDWDVPGWMTDSTEPLGQDWWPEDR